MIYVNNERINLEGDSRFAKEFQDAAKKIKKRGFPVVFNLNPKRVKIEISTKGVRNKRFPPQYIPYKATIDTPTGSEQWIYSRTTPVKDRNGNLKFNNNGRWAYKTSFLLTKNDLDLIFFLEYKCPLIKNNTFIVENKVLEAQKLADKEAKDVEIKFYIYGETSPLARFPEKLRTLAAAWGVRNALDKKLDGEYVVDISVIKHELFREVKSAEQRKGRGYKAFLQESEVGELTEKRAAIQQAIDKGVIGYNSRNYKFVFQDKEGKEMSVICSLAPQEVENKYDALFNYLNVNPAIMAVIYQSIGDTEKAGTNPTATQIQSATYNELVEMAKFAGLKSAFVKTEDLKQSLLTHYSYL